MFKRLLCLCLLFCNLGLMTTQAQDTNTSQEKALILYQERNFFGDRRDSVSVIEELLGHFDIQVTEAPIDTLNQQNLSLYDAVFVIALDQTIENSALTKELTTYEGQIIWLGNSVNTLIQAGQYPLRYDGENYNFVTLEIQTNRAPEPKIFSIGERRTFYQVSSLSDENKVYAWLSDGINRAPFIVTARNLSFVSRVDMNEPLFYIFAYFLHDLFQDKPVPANQLMVSIQDVHGFSDQENLRALADQLYASDIPFSIQLIPYFKMSGSKRLYRYDEIPQFVDTLRYIEARGGSILLEAFPAELSDKSIRALGLDVLYDKSPSPLKSYLEDMIHLMIRQKLQPVGVSSPHRALTDAEYLYLKTHMRNFIGHRYIAEGQLVVYPYVLENTKRFNRFYPLNLGYIDPSLPESGAVFDEQFFKIALVPECFTGVYLSPDLPPNLIPQLSEKAAAYRMDFFDIDQEPYWFHTDLVTYDSENPATTTLELEDPPVPLWRHFINFLSTAVLIILILGTFTFVRILRRSLKQTDEIHRRR